MSQGRQWQYLEISDGPWEMYSEGDEVKENKSETVKS